MKADPQPLQHAPRPRLKTLIVKNFRGIGVNPVEIELDKIIVLVGPNNVGKSSILRAYEIAMSEGSDEAKLSADDFPGGKTDGSVVPEIELHTVVYNTAPGQQWIFTDPLSGEMVVRERWRWFTPGAPTRQGYDVQINDWSNQVPWGAPNVANYNRPKPHRVDAFSDPKDQAQAIIKLLSDIVKERVKAIQEDSEEESDYKKLLTTIANMRKQVIEQSTSHIQAIEKQVSNMLGEVFPDYVIRFDPKEDDGLEQDLNLFKQLNNAQLLMGKGDGIGHLSTIDRQGSGARRTLLWSALRVSVKSNPPSTANRNMRK